MGNLVEQKMTACEPANDQKLFHLEAHPIECDVSQLLMSFSFMKAGTCYSYDYKCCEVDGVGGCEMFLTPWSDATPAVDQALQSDEALDSLTKHYITCKEDRALKL